MTQPHWWTTSIAFSIIIHIIVLKLFLETNFWNWYSAITGVSCVMLYYATVLLLSTQMVSELIQPELNAEFFRILQSAKAWIAIILLPVVALLPDLSLILVQKVFYPTPTDAVMDLQQKDPKYVFDGFRNVFVPGLPDPMKRQIEAEELLAESAEVIKE